MMFMILRILSLLVPVLLSMAYFTLLERKIIASIQRRKGPSVVGFGGIFQPLADGLKLFLKETIIPGSSNKVIFYLSPVVMLSVSFVAWMIVPLSYNVVIVDFNLCILLLLAVSSLGVYGIIFSGWSSNSKYAFLGSLRSAAQMVSYEVSLGLILMSILLGARSVHFNDLVEMQRYMWHIFVFFPCFMMFLISALAETNRPPFDLPEAEAELVAGYSVEYSSMGFALFFLGECSNVILMAVVLSIFFIGGWGYGWISFLYMKMVSIIFLFVWIRAVVPRYRYDQLMRLGWKVLLPLSLGYLFFAVGMILAFIL
jgi:NADH-quinone oxidoreductase subunit H